MCKCIVCEAKIDEIKSLGLQPLANKYPKDKNEIQNEFISSMSVHYCDNCLYVNLPCNISRDIFFEDYYYLSSVNRELVDHFDSLAHEINNFGSKFVLDIGSNDGILLSKLLKKNINCLGIDPSENVSQIANEQGLKTLVGFFDKDSANYIKTNFGRPDLITASSVFTHLEDPKSFFVNCKNLLKKGGRILIEVEYLADIVSNFAFERFYFDRPHYYSLKAMIKLAETSGYVLEDAKLINVHGGSIRAVFIEDSNVETSNRAREILEKEKSELSKKQLISKLDQFSSSCKVLKKKINNLKNKNIKFAAYGCPARFSTITNFAEITNNEIPYVIDDSPLKQSRLSPGMHIPIRQLNKEDIADVYIVFAYEYIESIKQKLNKPTIKFFRPVPFQEI